MSAEEGKPFSSADPDLAEPRQAFIERVRAEGHEVRTPLANQLFIDIDSEEAYECFHHALDVMHRNGIDPLSWDERESSSGLPNRHIVVNLPFDVDPYARIAWQAALGSDPVRELVSCLRLHKGVIFPTLFVERKP